jgi:hypothetical protein
MLMIACLSKRKERALLATLSTKKLLRLLAWRLLTRGTPCTDTVPKMTPSHRWTRYNDSPPSAEEPLPQSTEAYVAEDGPPSFALDDDSDSQHLVSDLHVARVSVQSEVARQLQEYVRLTTQQAQQARTLAARMIVVRVNLRTCHSEQAIAGNRGPYTGRVGGHASTHRAPLPERASCEKKSRGG